MSLVAIPVFLLLIFSGSIFSTTYFKTKFETLLPITCSAMIAISFLMGIVGLLKYSTLVLCAIALVLYVLAIFKLIKEREFKNLLINTFTPGFVIYVLLCIIFFVAIKGKVMDSWDEFSHWGDIVKVMTTIDDFGTNPSSNSIFKSYPPGMSLFQYILQELNCFFIKAVFSEWMCYFAYYILAVAYLVPFTSKLSFRKPLGIICFVIAIILVPFAFYYGVYYQLYIDPFLSFLLAAGCLELLWSDKCDIIFDLSMASIMFVLVLAKDAGLEFAAFLAIGYVARTVLANKEKLLCKKNIICLAIAILSIAVPKLLWNLNIEMNHVNVAFSAKADIKSLINVLTGKEDSYRYTVLKNYITAFLTKGISISNTGIYINYTVLTILSITGVYFATKVVNKGKIESLISRIVMYASALIFMIGMCVIYMYKFSEGEALGLASLDRYLAIVFLGMWLYIIINLLLAVEELEYRKVYCGLLVSLMAICAPLEIVVPYLMRTTVKSSNALRAEYNTILEKTAKYADGNDNIYFICQETTGFERLIYKFCVRPNVSNSYWSIGKSFYDGDDWSIEITAIEWQKVLVEEFDYVVLYKLNDYFYEEFGCLFVNFADIQENCIYVVNKQTGLLELCE